ncbi:MAG: response regulator [Anaerolineae bacterium]
MSKPYGLVIEDNPDLATIFCEALQAAEFETRIIDDGQEALEYLATARPDLIVLDLHLPHTSGDTILREIRSNERLAGIRVVIATADPQMAESLDKDSDLVLLKPVSFNQLRDLAARLAPRSKE